MNGIRRLLGVAVVVTLAAFSLPGIAAKGGNNNGTDKAYSLVMDEQAEYTTDSPSQVKTPVKVQAFLKNEAPPSAGSASNIGSFELVITNPGVTIFVDAEHPLSGETINVGPNGTLVPIADTATAPYTRIRVTNLSPLKAQQTYVVTFYVTSCGDALWDANVRTGSSLNGDPFTRIKDNIDSSTHLATNLQTLISCGTLACGDSVTLVADEANTSPELVVARGPYNSDGACAATSTFFASNKLVTDNGQVHFRWPVGDADQKLSVWMYNVVLAGSAVPRLAWLNNDGSKASAAFPDPMATQPQLPAYLDGLTLEQLQCVPLPGQPDPLPRPYGALSNLANQNTTTLKVNTSPQNAVLPTPAVPFDIVIGTERMRVIDVQGSTWTVDNSPTRNKGGTSLASHPAGAKVMSTPLPLLPNSGFAARVFDGTVGGTLLSPAPSPYTFGDQARMCIVGLPVVDSVNNTSSWTIMDLSDGWVRIGQ